MVVHTHDSDTDNFDDKDNEMRFSARTALAAAACVPLALVAPAMASAAEPTDVSFAFSSDGSTVTNTITNNSGTALSCTTSVSDAPGGVLPPIRELGGQTLYEGGIVEPGVSSQTIVGIPDGSYVALATCGRTEPDQVMWVSDYPGLEDVLKLYPTPSFAVQEASPIVVLPTVEPAQPIPDFLSQLGSIFGS